MDEKNSAPPSYYPDQPQTNEGYEAAPPYPGTQNAPPYYAGPQNPPPPPGGYSQQPGQGYVFTTVYNQPQPVNNVVVTSVDDNMGMAIFATFCCFWPLGLVAIMRAYEVKSALAVNDFVRAQRLADESKRLSRLSIIIGAVLLVVVFVIVLVVNLSTVYQ